MKIIINTNDYYKTPLKHLMLSILNSGFKNFEDIVIVISESTINENPKLVNLSELVDVNTDKQVVVIRLALNNYDYVGFAALHLFKDHELVKSEKYFYLLDTSEVETGFYEKIIKFEYINNDQLVVNGPVGNSNIIIFGHKIIDLYGDRYNRNFTKREAVLLEVSKEFILNGINYCGFYFHPNAIKYPEREEIGLVDIYNTGNDWIKFYYKEFGVYKYVFFLKDGDIKNNVVTLDFD